jgi:mannosyltransferase
LPAFESLLLVAVVYALGRCLFAQTLRSTGNKTGLIAALIFAVMPYQVFQAQQANLYSLLVLLAGLQVLFFWLALRDGRRAWFAGYVLTAAAGIYVHYFAALVTLALHIWLLAAGQIQSGRDYRRRWPSLLAADAFLILLALPIGFYFLRGAGEVGAGFWLERPSVVAPLSTLYLFTVSYSLTGLWAAAGFILTLILVALVFLELAYGYRQRPQERPALLMLLLLAFLPILLIFLVSQFVPLYLDRTLIICTPAYALLLGRALATTRRRSPVPYLAGALLAVLIVSLYGYYVVADHSKPDYRAASAYLDQKVRPGQALVHTGNGSFIPFLFYRGPDDHFLLDGDPAPHHPPELHQVAGGRSVDESELAMWPTIWLVTAFDHSIPYQEGVLTGFDANYELLEETTIDGIVLRHYDMGGQ